MREADAAGYQAAQLATILGGELQGPNLPVDRLSAVDAPASGAVVVAPDAPSLQRALASPGAVIVAPHEQDSPLELPVNSAVILVADTRVALAKLSALFDNRPRPPEGVHPSASLSETAQLAKGVRVAAGAVIGPDAVIGEHTVVGPGVVVGEGARVGASCHLHARVALLDGVRLGDRVIVQAGAVLGSDGFGYAPSPRGAQKIHHLGGLVVADDVEIGANTTIDRGTLGDTRIGARTKIDNLCQIAHNVQIGEDCLIAGQCGISGSTQVGDRVTMAGSVGVGDHLSIGTGATLGPRAAVLKSVPAGETWLGYPAQPYRRFVRHSYLQGRLERIWAFVRAQERSGAQQEQATAASSERKEGQRKEQ